MFWIVALLMGLVASAFILAPLVFGRSQAYRDQRADINLSIYRERIAELNETDAGEGGEDNEALELDAKRALLRDVEPGGGDPDDEQQLVAGGQYRRFSLAAAILVPILALAIYADFGLGRGALPDVDLAKAMHSVDPSDPAAYRYFVQQVERRVVQRPSDTDTLFLLARGYVNLGEYRKAVAAYGNLLKLFPGDPNLLSQYAEMLYVVDDRRFTDRVAAAVDRALEANPMDTTMLELRGIAAAAEGNIPQALTWLNRALQSGVSGPRAELIRSAISRFHDQAGLTAAETASTESASGAQSGAAGSDGEMNDNPSDIPGRVITVKVSAGSEVDLPSNAAVFIYARAVQGPPAPLAVRRVRLDQLPLEVRLDESMAMMPGMGLANFDEVIVIARASASGQVTPSPGDFEVRSGKLNLGGKIPVLELDITEQLL